MKFITFILVNYNNSDKSIQCIKSIIKTLKNNFQIFIVDNSSKIEEKNKLLNWRIANEIDFVTIWLTENIGYFPAISYVYKNYHEDMKNSDFLIIGNNDIVFNENFFLNLTQSKYNNDVFVISPSIINNNGLKQNPHILLRYTYLQHIFLEIYHLSYFFALIINSISKILKFRGSQKNKKGSDKSQYISIGYGAVFILNQNYINYINQIPDYLFLMNEECALSKIVFDNNGRIFYDKELVVYHDEHSSINLVPNKTLYKISKESYKISKRYFNNLKIYDKRLINEKL
jgi:GT2 family glycosyltransferase